MLKKVSFKNQEGKVLHGRIEFPPDRHPENFALLAHCFTCTKNITALVMIGRELTQAGFGILRFDFTGLGESEGDFENTNFSGNVSDLIAAAEFLAEKYISPSLLVGHSLGGSAVLYAAKQLPYVKAVATINSPSDPSHVTNLLKDDLETIEEQGYSRVMLADREFTIKKQFLDDLEAQPPKEVVSRLGKALLILHTPQDTIVDIQNAERLYIAAHHPKSYISLDGADHLLSKREDAKYAGSMIASWVKRYVSPTPERTLKTKNQVAASLDFESNFTTDLKLGKHYLTADEPERYGGDNFGPTPYDFLSAGLAACTAMTLQMYARRKKWNLKNVTVHIDHSRDHAIDTENEDEKSAKIDTFTKYLDLEGDLDPVQRERLLEIADRCPVHKTLTSEIQILSHLKKK
ncbi:MAG TPA: alpha/beta fold hydrolase [Flavobacteriaceae bacterium]|nr:alpha/beta fold hydrolase [Flavobacteriaceae bacterium]